MKYRTYAAACAVAAALGLGAEPVPTGTTTNADSQVTTELPSIIVEASRRGLSPNDIPGAVSVLPRSEITASGAQNVPELIARAAPGLNVIQTGAGNPALAQIVASGYGETGFGRFLVMVDGQRINYADISAPLLSQIDLGAVERVEILHGSQAVLHGDNASAGAINIVTDPQTYDFGGRVETHAGSWDSYGMRASVHDGDAKAGVKAWGNSSWDHSSGYRENNDWQTWSLGGGLLKEWENGSRLRISSFWNDAQYELPGYVPATDWKHDRRAASSPDDWYRRTSYGLNTSLDMAATETQHVKLDFAFSGSNMKSRNFYRSGDYTDDFRMFNDLYSFELTPQWICTEEIAGFENKGILGLTYRYDRLHGTNRDSSSSGLTESKYEYNRQTLGVFAQDTFHFNETVAVEAGGRFQRQWNENTALVDPRRITDMTAYDAALLFTPTDELKTYARFSSFFRSPFLDENPYKNYAAQSLLSPERGLAVHVGGTWTPVDELTLFADAALSRTKNEILYDQFFWGTNVNAPDPVLRETLTVGGRWERDKVAGVSLAYTYTDAAFDGGVYDGKDIPLCARSTIHTSGRVWIWDECFVFGGYRFQTARYAISDFANEGPRLASCGLVNVGVRYEPEVEWLKGFYASLAVDNLLDRRYAGSAVRTANGAVFYPGAGRCVTLTLGWEF